MNRIATLRPARNQPELRCTQAQQYFLYECLERVHTRKTFQTTPSTFSPATARIKTCCNQRRTAQSVHNTNSQSYVITLLRAQAQNTRKDDKLARTRTARTHHQLDYTICMHTGTRARGSSSKSTTTSGGVMRVFKIIMTVVVVVVATRANFEFRRRHAATALR